MDYFEEKTAQYKKYKRIMTVWLCPEHREKQQYSHNTL